MTSIGIRDIIIAERNTMQETYDFDDVLIKPIPSSVSSRDDVDISVVLPNGKKLFFPLLASPMVGVVDGAFASRLSFLGGLAIMHRFYKSREKLFEDVKNNLVIGKDNFGLSLRIGEEGIEEYLDYSPDILLVDTANGYSETLLRYCERVKTVIINRNYKTALMAGNVATFEGSQHLHDSGCDMIRVGIGGGSPCSTRNQTGIGIPNISALLDCSGDYAFDYMLVIDGGIKNSGDFVKSIVAGADLGMSGKLYAECFEAPNDGVLYGMASRTHMENIKMKVKSVEGFDIRITKKQPLDQFVSEFGYGIKSAGTYLNASTLREIFCNGRFVRVSDSAIKKGI